MKASLLIVGAIVCAVPFRPACAQWQKYQIDGHVNAAVSVDPVDMTGDSKLDLIVTNALGTELILYQNNFPEWIKHTIDDVGATWAFSGDIDGDDTLDVVACLWFEHKIVWYENNHPTWTQHVIEASTENEDFTLVADFNNDGRPDVVTASGFPNGFPAGGGLVWYENDHPNWTKHVIESGSDMYPSLNVIDIDDDGLLDVVATMSPANNVVWFRNEDNGLEWTKHTIDSSLVAAWGVNSGDVDGDGAIDVVATSGGPYASGTDVIWYRNHHPTWTKHVIDADFNGSNWAGVSDVDGDGTMDVVAASYDNDAVVWYENDHPTWRQHVIDADLDGPRVFAVADVDGDSLNDLIVPGERSVVWYQHPGSSVGIEAQPEIISAGYRLLPNYPNPFTSDGAGTTISYALPRTTAIALTLEDLTGRRVRILDSGLKPAGSHQLTFDAADLPSGVYFYRLEAGDFVETRSLILAK